MLFGGAGWLRPIDHVQIAWGSNFGPYTTDGDWWRLLTASFIHFGLVHIGFNMLALASFGALGGAPLRQREVSAAISVSRNIGEPLQRFVAPRS
jgi:membrane associated rhomboid family serine protease